MTLNERHFGYAVILDVRGPIAGRDAAGSVVAAVKRNARNGTRTMIVNLSGVPRIDLGGLGALLEAARMMRAAGGVLSLSGVTRRIQDLIVITRLSIMFDTYDSPEDAMAAATGVTVEQTTVPSAATIGAVTRFLRRA